VLGALTSQTTPLSSGQLNGQTFTIELVQTGNDMSAAVVVRWPAEPTIVSPANYDQLAAAAMRLLANASVELAASRSGSGCDKPSS
jgi:hypothetical protein